MRSLASMIAKEEDLVASVVSLEDKLRRAGRVHEDASASSLPKPLFGAAAQDVDATSPEFLRAVEEAQLQAALEVQELNSRDMADMGERYSRTFMKLDEAIASVSKVLTSEVVELALFVAQEILHAELSVSPELVFDAVERALAGVEHDGKVSVQVNPDDLVGIRARLQERGELAMNVHGDPQLRRGDCIVEMPERIIDATLKARMEAVRETLVRALVAEEREGEAARDTDA